MGVMAKAAVARTTVDARTMFNVGMRIIEDLVGWRI
jgi:hypothetical protein